MTISTQVAGKDRQTASGYPYPLTLLLGVLNVVSAGVVIGVLSYFVYHLRMDNHSIPGEFIYV